MLINIFWTFNKEGGGGNQFLNILKRFFIDNKIYEEDPHKADVILVNSKDCLDEASLFSDKIIVHRIDGIFSLYRGKEHKSLDEKVYNFVKKYAHGVIFQSSWSMLASKNNGMGNHSNEIIIKNCADDRFFNNRYTKTKNDKIRIITSSWSSNWKKGFKIYEFLDKNLDFSRFEYVFVGRSPVQFKNIRMMGIKSIKELSEELKKSDMFVTASEDDACSNALIEALSCGLPSLGLNSGGTPEIIDINNGKLFNKEDVIDKIEEIAYRITHNMLYNIKIDTIDQVGNQYYRFMEKIYNEKH